jgi:hypothetical protein
MSAPRPRLVRVVPTVLWAAAAAFGIGALLGLL